MTTTIDELRRHRAPARLLKGFAPLVLAVILIVLMMLSVPSVAPEEIVRTPVTEKAQ